jgi:HlyD family secretion protein
MFTKYVLPLAAIAGLTFACYSVWKSRQIEPASTPLVMPATRPNYIRSIAGSGIVEARRENIPIGVNVPGVVTQVYVKKGDLVKQGDPLFRVDDRDLKAMLRVRHAELASAKAQWHKLKMAPRPEDVPPAEAAVMEAKARLDDTEAAMARTERLYNRQMVPAGDWDRDRFAYLAAKATYAKNLANLDLLKKGTWEEDLQVAQAAIDLAEAQVESINTNLERLTARAPTDGEILQLNVRLGQYAAMQWKEPMIVLGDVNRLHVRADIDESDVPWFDPNAPAVATLKGRPQVRFPLTVVYVEPYVVPKQSLTGSNSERVDTRVLQVIYALPDERSVPLHVGQQMDVYMKAAKEPEGVQLDPAQRPALPFEDEEPKASPRAKSKTHANAG